MVKPPVIGNNQHLCNEYTLSHSEFAVSRRHEAQTYTLLHHLWSDPIPHCPKRSISLKGDQINGHNPASGQVLSVLSALYF